MNILFNSLAKNKKIFRNLSKLLLHDRVISYSAIRTTHSHDEDTFGISSKYAQLDTKVKNNCQKDGDKNRVLLEEDDTRFGTLSGTQEYLEFKESLDLIKPLHETKILDKNEKVEQEYDKILSHIRLSNENRPNNEQYYGLKINELANSGKLKEAIDVFFVEMIDRDRFKPTLWLYKTLMRHLAKQGYTHMVFELFKKITSSRDDDWNDSKNMTKLHQIITILFHSCSNSPWKEYSVRKCDSIRVYLKNRKILPNQKNYAAMISAYGKAGAIYESFNAVDEMIYFKLKPDVDIINNLLCACISQPNYGFRYSLMAWQTALKLKIKPDLNSFNLILKAANDCGINKKKDKVYLNKNRRILNENKNLFPNDSDDFKQFSDEDFNFLSNNSENFQDESTHEKIIFLNQNTIEKIDQDPNSVIKIKEDEVHVIDDLKVIGKTLEEKIKNLEWWQDIKSNIDKGELLEGLSSFRPEIKNIILAQNFDSLLTRFRDNTEKEIFDYVTEQMDSPEGHLEMLGGLEGILKSMNYHRIEPDFKTFNLIIQLMTNDLENENKILCSMEQCAIKPNIDLINLLIKRRMLRKDKFQIDDVFELMQKNNLSPNIMTFGCMAYGINTYDLLVQFLTDMKEAGFKLNSIIITTLYSTGRFKKDIKYLSHLFRYVKEQELSIDKMLKDKIELDMESMKKELIRMEKTDQNIQKEKVYYTRLNKFYNMFKSLYIECIQEIKMNKYQHPYAKFARKDDKLYQIFVKKTERLEQSEKN